MLYIDGQTGSGKTFTMQGVQAFVAQDLFDLIERHDSSIKVSGGALIGITLHPENVVSNKVMLITYSVH